MLPISKSKGRALLREAEEERCVDEASNFISTRHTQTARSLFSLPCTEGTETLARDQHAHLGVPFW